MVSTSSPCDSRCVIVLLSSSNRSNVSTQNDGMDASSLISCRWLVFEELNPPTTSIMSGLSSTSLYMASWRSCVASQMVSMTM